jgi:TolB-like protein
MKKRNYLMHFAFLIFLTSSVSVIAQTNLVISDFYNNTDVYSLDSWERVVPDLLYGELSKYDDLTILERNKLNTLFKEHELALAGFTDSSNIEKIGKLAGADFILSGSVNKIENKYRITVKITRVKTGMVSIEIAESHSAAYLPQMIKLLGANIYFRLSGRGEYLERIKISKYPAHWTALAGAAFSGMALYYNAKSAEAYDRYKDAKKLGKFDKPYSDAEDAQTASWILGGVGLAALSTSLYFYIVNDSIEDVKAASEKKITYTPQLRLNDGKGVSIALQIHF